MQHLDLTRHLLIQVLHQMLWHHIVEFLWSFMEVTSKQSKQITSLNATIQDTVKWTPAANL